MLSREFRVKNQHEMVENKLAKPQRARITDRGIDAYSLYRYDLDTKDFLPFFNNTHDTPKGLRQFCDYILLANKGNRLYILLIEMKSGDASDAHLQLKASETYMEYIKMSAQRISGHNDNPDFNPDNITVKRIILSPCSPSLSRPTTNAKKNAQRELHKDPITLRDSTFNIAYICGAH